MCDYNSYQEIRQKHVVTRKPQECGSCSEIYPAGTKMLYSVGFTEGEFSTTYGCPACIFAFNQEDETALHLCWGWGYDRWDDDPERYEYIKAELAAGRKPTVDGFKAHMATLVESEDE